MKRVRDFHLKKSGYGFGAAIELAGVMINSLPGPKRRFFLPRRENISSASIS
jgi:hypothetical protein